MAAVAQRWDAWLDLVSELAARPCAEFPKAEVMEMVRLTFQTRVSYNWMDSLGEFDFEMDDPIPGWPTDADYEFWAREGHAKHPLLCFYGRTGLPRPMTVGRVPRQLVPHDGFDVLRETLGPVGLDEQLSIPFELSPTTHRAFVLAQTGEDYSDEDVELARRVQPLLGLLYRQSTLLAGADCELGGAFGLTGRELAVLQLLSEGCTAVAIAHTLRVSPRTIHSHLAHIYRKLGVCDRMRAVLVARELGVLE